jgi:hypothetical protein
MNLLGKQRILWALIFFIGMLHANKSSSQQAKAISPKAKAEKEFVDYLNKICNEYVENQMGFEMGRTVVPFKIDGKGNLSTVRKFKGEEDSLFRRFTLQVKDIEAVFFDYYIGFETVKSYNVTTDTTSSIKAGFKFASYNNLLHIAPVGDGWHGEEIQQRLTALLKKLKPFYIPKSK